MKCVIYLLILSSYLENSSALVTKCCFAPLHFHLALLESGSVDFTGNRHNGQRLGGFFSEKSILVFISAHRTILTKNTRTRN